MLAVSAPAWHDVAMTKTVDPPAASVREVAGATTRRGRPTGEPSMAREPDYHTGRPTKVAVVGTGMVGSTFAYTLLLSGIAS